MSKKKISSNDFLNLLDQQESIAEKIAFKPKATAEKKLGPVQQELLDFAKSKAPRFVTKWATTLVERIRK